MSFEKQLKKAKDAWKKALKKKPDFGSDLPDGTYHSRIVKAELGESQSSGNMQVAWRAVVLEGDNKGENISWYSQMKTEDNLMYLQRDITKLGFEAPEDISEIENILKDIVKKKPGVRLTLKTNGDFQNVRIGKLLSDEDVADEGDDEEPEEPEAEEEDAKEEKEEEAEEEDDSEEEDSEEEAEEEAEEEEEEDEEEEEPTVEVGMRVAFTNKGKEVVGEVTKIIKDEGKVSVKTDDGTKFKVSVEKLRPAPKAKVTKKNK